LDYIFFRGTPFKENTILNNLIYNIFSHKRYINYLRDRVKLNDTMETETLRRDTSI